MVPIAEAVRMYDDMREARRCAKWICANAYAETVQPYRDVIRRIAAEEQISIVRALVRIGGAQPPEDAIPLMLLLAAGLDEIEAEAQDACVRATAAAGPGPGPEVRS
jgi:hypothetical protein